MSLWLILALAGVWIALCVIVLSLSAMAARGDRGAQEGIGDRGAEEGIGDDPRGADSRRACFSHRRSGHREASNSGAITRFAAAENAPGATPRAG